MPYTAYIDGGARGNPGPSGAGVHILDDGGKVVFSAGLFLGHKTNNEAEYAGLLQALDLLAAAGAGTVLIRSDSELLVRQMQGSYRVKAPNLKPLFENAAARAARFKACRFEHVRREQNKDADRLANAAMDAVGDVVEVDVPGLAGKADRPVVAPTPARAVGGAARRAGDSGERSSASRGVASQAGTLRGAVAVSVVKAPAGGRCPAGMRAGAVFTFSDVVPAGMCLEACSTVIDAVLALRAMAQDDDEAPLEPMTITCQRPDCGAVFQLRAGR